MACEEVFQLVMITLYNEEYFNHFETCFREACAQAPLSDMLRQIVSTDTILSSIAVALGRTSELLAQDAVRFGSDELRTLSH